MFSQENKRLQRDFTEVMKYEKGSYKSDGDKLFSKTCCKMKSDDVFKLKGGRID